MKVRYTPRAQSDLDAIFNYLEQHDRVAAQTAKEVIEHRIARLADFPYMAPDTDESGIHELAIVRYPYKVYYEIEFKEVWVLHIRDERRNPWKEFAG